MAEITLKLLVDGNTKKVLYAEAKKDFVDFLFGLLQVPIGTIIGLLKQNNIPTSGSFDRVLDSVSNLENTHFHSSRHKENILSPILVAHTSDRTQYSPPLLLKNFVSFKEIKEGSSSSYSHSGSSYQSSKESEVQFGYVKDLCLTYMVTDDLLVNPMSTISIFSILHMFGVKDIGSLQEKTVKVDFKMGLELLKAAMESDTVLTDVFLSKNINTLPVEVGPPSVSESDFDLKDYFKEAN